MICINCGEKFSSVNIFTDAGARESQISSMCEKCFDELFADEDDPDEELICIRCNGSGEGQHDGTSCGSCGGSGVERKRNEDESKDL